VLYYPPSWRPQRGDPGTATAVERDAHGRLVGYLNLTPREDGEKLIDWASFRVRHNAREGDSAVRSEAIWHDVRFRGGVGACVRDSYTTSSRTRYVELACLVRGAHATSVIVAASPPQQWASAAPVLLRALGAFTP
jgi:hypothetical protein